LTKRIPGVVTIAEDGHTRKVAQRSLEIVENHIRAGPIIKCPNGAIIELGQLGKPNSEPFARGVCASPAVAVELVRPKNYEHRAYRYPVHPHDFSSSSSAHVSRRSVSGELTQHQ